MFQKALLVFGIAAIAVVGLSGSILSSIADDPYELVSCATTATGADTYTQRGTYCSSSFGNPHQDDSKALDKANLEFTRWVQRSHRCAGCESPQVGCTASMAFIPDPPFASTDCTFTLGGQCEGNPLKVLVIATCTNDVVWGFACDACNNP